MRLSKKVMMLRGSVGLLWVLGAGQAIAGGTFAFVSERKPSVFVSDFQGQAVALEPITFSFLFRGPAQDGSPMLGASKSLVQAPSSANLYSAELTPSRSLDEAVSLPAMDRPSLALSQDLVWLPEMGWVEWLDANCVVPLAALLGLPFFVLAARRRKRQSEGTTSHGLRIRASMRSSHYSS